MTWQEHTVNSVSEKIIESFRKSGNERLPTNLKGPQTVAHQQYVLRKKFGKNLILIHKIEEVLALNKVAYMGKCILDLSKTLIYDNHYDYIKEKYGMTARLLFADSRPFTYQIETNDVYQDFHKNKRKIWVEQLLKTIRGLWWNEQNDRWWNERWNRKYFNYWACWIKI